MSQQQREQAALLGSRRVAPVVLAGVNGSKRGRLAPTITLARAATQKEGLNTRSYNEGKKLVCKFCRQYAVNNSVQKVCPQQVVGWVDLMHPLPQISWGQCAEIPTAATRDP